MSSNNDTSRILSNYQSLQHFVRSCLSDHRLSDSEDIVQETFVEAWRNQSTLQAFALPDVGVWLRTVAKRKMIDRHRKANAKKRNNGNQVLNLVDESIPVAGRCTPSSFAASREAGEILASAMERLTDRHRKAIELRYYRQLPFREVAEALEVSDKAAQMLVKRALICLRQELGDRRSKFM